MEGSSLSEFTIKDSGERRSFESGMVRDTAEGKINFLNVRFGPMLKRWACHLTKGRVKYPDVEPGVPNWTLAAGVEELLRAKESAERHFDAWLSGQRDEDHAAAMFFNINLAEYVLENDPSINPGLGASIVPAPAPVTQTGEQMFSDLVDYSKEYNSELVCEHREKDGWVCERPKDHEGLHAAHARYRPTPWDDSGE